VTPEHTNGTRLYIGSADDDILVAQWWLRMSQDGDLPALFTRDSQTIGALYRIIGRPKVLVYDRDAAGIWFAMWAEPVLSGLFTGLWIRRGRRRSHEALALTLDTYAWYFTQVPVIFGITKQEKLLRPHRRLGYTILSRVAGLWDGDPAWIVELTRERFAETLRRHRRPCVEMAVAMEAVR